MSDKWDKRWLLQARTMAPWSTNPGGKSSCILTDVNNRVLGAGVNGFPKGMDDVADEFRHHLMIHAEVNALLACRDQVHNVYVYPYMPCSKCASLLVQIGAKRFISVQDAAEHWRPELTALLANRYLIERVWITEEELDDTM